jgi:hypothetical protein
MSLIYSIVQNVVDEGKDKAEIDLKKSFFFSSNFIS